MRGGVPVYVNPIINCYINNSTKTDRNDESVDCINNSTITDTNDKSVGVEIRKSMEKNNFRCRLPLTLQGMSRMYYLCKSRRPPSTLTYIS